MAQDHDNKNNDPRPEDLDAARAADARDGAAPIEWDLSDLSEPKGDTGAAQGTASGGFWGSQDAALRQELDAERGRNLRLLADFQNFQRRAAQNEVVARQMGVSSVVSSVVTVIDHFDIALNQDASKASAQQIVDGVKVIRDELIRSLARHGVSIEAPAPNASFVPGKHEAIMQQQGQGVESGNIVATFQAGFILRDGEHERVIRPAKVSVAP